MKCEQLKTVNDYKKCVTDIVNHLGYNVETLGNRTVIIFNGYYLFLQNFEYAKSCGKFEIVMKVKEDLKYKRVHRTEIVSENISDLQQLIQGYFTALLNSKYIKHLKKENIDNSAVILSQLEKIAQDLLDIPTLERRKSDSLDFYDISVWRLKDALMAAYELGKSKVK